MLSLIKEDLFKQSISKRLKSFVEIENWNSPISIKTSFSYFLIFDWSWLDEVIKFRLPDGTLSDYVYIAPYFINDNAKIDLEIYRVENSDIDNRNSNNLREKNNDPDGLVDGVLYCSFGAYILPTKVDAVFWYSCFLECCICGFMNEIDLNEFKKNNDFYYMNLEETANFISPLERKVDESWKELNLRLKLGHISNKIIK